MTNVFMGKIDPSFKKDLEEYLPFLSLFSFFLLTTYLFWPGVLRPDSMGQYSQSLSNTFSDHHPPMMAFYWRLLNFLYPGSGPMLITHLALLWGSPYFFIRALKKEGASQKWVWFYVFLPFWPSILGYSIFILKDTGFCLSFLLTSSVLTYYTYHKKSLSWFLILGLSILLFYGTAVKFQAFYILPVPLLWISLLKMKNEPFWKKIGFWIGLWGIFAIGLHSFNRAITTHQNHSWQYVKLYDLAAISLELETPFFPDFVQKGPNFSMETLKKTFSTERVDEIVFGENPPLIPGSTPQERKEIWDTWWHTIKENPGSYFRHRFRLASHLLNKSPIKPVNIIQDSGEAMIPPFLLEILTQFNKKALRIVQSITSFQYFFPVLWIYFFIGLFNLNRSPSSLPLVMMTGMGLLLIGILFIFSMASDARYIYFSVCCFHFSHFFAYKTIQDSLKKIKFSI